MQDVGLKRNLIVSRIALGVLGGYAFVWGFIALGIVLGVAAGMNYFEAQTLVFLLAFLIYLTVFCWAFAVRNLALGWTALAGGGALMTGAAWLLSRSAG